MRDRERQNICPAANVDNPIAHRRIAGTVRLVACY